MARTYSAPQTWTDGSYPGATDLNREVRDNVTYLQQPSYTMAYRTSNVAFTAGADQTVSFQATETDTDDMWVVGTPTRLTIPTGWAGLWHFNGQVSVTSAAANTDIRVNASLRLNGTTIIYTHSVASRGSTVQYTTVPISRYYRCIVGDYVEVRYWTSSNYDELVSGVSETFLEACWRGV